MSDIAIQVENISKRYRIGMAEQMHDTLFGMVTSWIKSPLSNFKRLQKLSRFRGSDDADDVIWAVNDVSFNVKYGEVLGIIGKNGAGKSTLLKILCQITEPTRGRAIVNGRIASLLEVGTGFHPELTGRENVYLNGTILGMRKAEITRKFDEIVDFSGVEKFIDTPVKRYSSGMRVRLGFAVAAHLDPEILLIDEVLAVGDVEFQRKCLGKMDEVAKGGRTVLFVSHNMNSINRLCNRTVLLNNGKVSYIGETNEVIRRYLNLDRDDIGSRAVFEDDPEKPYQVRSISLHHLNGELVDRPLETHESFLVRIEYLLRKELVGGYASFVLRNSSDEFVLISDNRDNGQSVQFEKPGEYNIEIKCPAPLLVPRKYFLSPSLAQQPRGGIHGERNAVSFEIVDVRGARSRRVGYINVPLKWKSKENTSPVDESQLLY